MNVGAGGKIGGVKGDAGRLGNGEEMDAVLGDVGKGEEKVFDRISVSKCSYWCCCRTTKNLIHCCISTWYCTS